MDLATKTRISDRIKLRLMSTTSGLASSETNIDVLTHDTDISALQPLIGDHFTFQCSGTIRIADWLKAHPEDGENS